MSFEAICPFIARSEAAGRVTGLQGKRSDGGDSEERAMNSHSVKEVSSSVLPVECLSYMRACEHMGGKRGTE